MKRFLLLAVVLIFVSSGPILGAIVYSGSQSVTLTLQGGPSPPTEREIINIAGSGEDWDDFMVELSFNDMMMSMMSHLSIYPMGMGAMGMVGIVGFTNTYEFASNLDPGTEIGVNSPLVSMGYLTNFGFGEFGEEGGYIGLMMDVPNGSPHPGWLHVSEQWDIGTNIHSIMFDGWAYEDQAGISIGAGDIPEPSSLLLCSLGGLVAWLRRRRAL